MDFLSFSIGVFVGAVGVFLCWGWKNMKREDYERKRVLEMKSRIQPFRELQVRAMEDKDREIVDKCTLEIYRIISEYAPTF